MPQKIIIIILTLCGLVSLCSAAEQTEPDPRPKQQTGLPLILERVSLLENKISSFEGKLDQFGQNLREESDKYRQKVEKIEKDLEKLQEELTKTVQSLPQPLKMEDIQKYDSKFKEGLIKELKDFVQNLPQSSKSEDSQSRENVESEIQTLRNNILFATGINAIITLIGVIILVGWFEFRRGIVYPSSMPVSPEPKPSPEKEKPQTDDLLRVLASIDELKRNLNRTQDSSALIDLRIKTRSLEEDLKAAQQLSNSLQEEKDKAVQQKFQLMNEIAEINTKLTSACEELRREQAEVNKYKTLLEKEQEIKQKNLSEEMRGDSDIQEDLKALQNEPKVQIQAQRLIQLLGLLDKSSEKLYPYILYELSVILAEALRQSGLSEAGVQSRLQSWAKVLSRNSLGFLIQVPRLNERITPQMVVSSRNRDGIVHKVKSWCIMRQGNCVLSAEVE